MSISYWLDETHKKSVDFDFVIVGAGIAGISTAYWLEKKFKTAKIAIVERHRLGFGASGRNAGFVTCGSVEHFSQLVKKFQMEKAVEIWKFSEQNRELLNSEIIQDGAEELEFAQKGSCTVAPTSADWQRYQELAPIMQKHGIDVELIDPVALKKDYGVKNFEGAIEYKHDGYVHPIKLLKKIFSKLKRSTLFESEEAFKIDSQAGKKILITDKHLFKTPKIILTLNAYLPLLAPEWSHEVVPQRGQIFVSEPLPLFVKGPCYLTKHLCYFRQMPSGELLIGGFRNVALEQENTFLDQPTDKIQEALLNFAKDYFEFGSLIKVKYQWSGIMGFTRDGQMLIGSHKKNPDVAIIAGCSGHGMGLSFNAAATLVNHLDGQNVPAHLDINRITHF